MILERESSGKHKSHIMPCPQQHVVVLRQMNQEIVKENRAVIESKV